jgi:thiamine pyrophosphate-dependent acetolactate synthase large subunit-like protein
VRLIEAYGGHGERVDDPDRLVDALRKARELAASGTQSLISITCQ